MEHKEIGYLKKQTKRELIFLENEKTFQVFEEKQINGTINRNLFYIDQSKKITKKVLRWYF